MGNALRDANAPVEPEVVASHPPLGARRAPAASATRRRHLWHGRREQRLEARITSQRGEDRIEA